MGPSSGGIIDAAKFICDRDTESAWSISIEVNGYSLDYTLGFITSGGNCYNVMCVCGIGSLGAHI